MGCVFAIVVALIALIALGGGLGLVIQVIEPGKGVSPAVPVMTFVILGALLWFLTTVARRLLAAMRGKPVPHLFPPIVGVILAAMLGLGGVGIAVGSLVHGGPGIGRGLGASIVFLAFAVAQTRAMIKRRRAASPPDTSNPT